MQEQQPKRKGGRKPGKRFKKTTVTIEPATLKKFEESGENLSEAIREALELREWLKREGSYEEILAQCKIAVAKIDKAIKVSQERLIPFPTSHRYHLDSTDAVIQLLYEQTTIPDLIKVLDAPAVQRIFQADSNYARAQILHTLREILGDMFRFTPENRERYRRQFLWLVDEAKSRGLGRGSQFYKGHPAIVEYAKTHYPFSSEEQFYRQVNLGDLAIEMPDELFAIMSKYWESKEREDKEKEESEKKEGELKLPGESSPILDEEPVNDVATSEMESQPWDLDFADDVEIENVREGELRLKTPTDPIFKKKKTK